MNQGVWQVLSGGLIAIISIFLTNIYNNRRLRDQMAFDKEQKALERLTKLRTDVYLEAAAKIVRMNSFIASMPQIDPAKLGERTEFTEFSEAAAKLSIVAEPDTSYQVGELVALISKGFIRSMLAALPVQSLDADIARELKTFDVANLAFQEVMQLRTAMLREVTIDQVRFEALEEEGNEYLRRMQASESRRAATADKRSKCLEEFNSTVLPMIMNARAPTVACLSRIRQDLGLTTHIGKWKDQMERHAAEAAAEYDQVMMSLKRMAEEDDKPK